MSESGTVPPEFGLIHLLQRLTAYVRESEPVLVVRQTDGSVIGLLKESEIELTKVILRYQFDGKHEHDEKCLKEHKLALEQLENPTFQFSLPVGRTVHYVPLEQKENLLKEIEEFIEWKKNKSPTSD